MSHGNLSPRQKMINMMYLVLTALLAMNVSAEILNAFVLVNDSLIKTEKGISSKNDVVYADFDGKFKANEKKVGPWRDKAVDVGNYSKELTAYITTLQKIILEASGEDYELFLKNGTGVIEDKKDRESPLHAMLEDKSEGKIRALILKNKIDKYRADIEKVLKGVDGGETVVNSMNINLSTTDMEGQDGGIKSWEMANFDQLPLVAVITMLTKLKTDVLNTESEAISNLYSQVDAKSYKFTDLNAIVTTDKGYILSGERYIAKIFVAASDTTQKPVIKLDNGSIIDSFDNTGKGIYSVTAGGYGIHKLSGKIIVQKPGSAELDSFPFSTEYQVAAPSVSVSPTKMNVFYIGVDNPVEITAAGTPADKVSASIRNGSIRKIGGSNYIVRVRSAGKTRVNVSANGRSLGSKEFRVKTLPSPVTTIGAPGSSYYKGGNCPQSTLLALSGINATMENFDFNLKFTVTKFTVTCNIGGFDESANSNSRRFTTQQKSIIRQAKRNSRVIIEGVKAKGPDGTVRKIGDLVLKLR
ncbi:MAG: gliding motility protein GldM [Bacteroidales bacterium]|nr:gliding motility protein GldM [Bacteroidales bacterium]